MNAAKGMVVAVALGLMGAGAGTLLHLRKIQRLGEPGLHVAARTNDLRVDILLPEQVLNYTSKPVVISDVELAVLPKDTSFARRLYRAPDGFEILLGVVLMGTDRTSIHKPEYCLTSQGWQIVERETSVIPMERPVPYELPVRVFTTRRLAQVGGRGMALGGAYLFWFVAGDYVTASHWTRAGLISLDLLRHGVLPRWAYVSVFVVSAPGAEAAAVRRAEEFIRAAVPEFQRTTGQPAGAMPAGKPTAQMDSPAPSPHLATGRLSVKRGARPKDSCRSEARLARNSTRDMNPGSVGRGSCRAAGLPGLTWLARRLALPASGPPHTAFNPRERLPV